MISPQNSAHLGDMETFTKRFGIQHTEIRQVLRGLAKHCRGWHLPDIKIKEIYIKNSKNQCFRVTEFNAWNFAKENGIDYDVLWKILEKKTIKSRCGWSRVAPPIDYQI